MFPDQIWQDREETFRCSDIIFSLIRSRNPFLKPDCCVSATFFSKLSDLWRHPINSAAATSLILFWATMEPWRSLIPAPLVGVYTSPSDADDSFTLVSIIKAEKISFPREGNISARRPFNQPESVPQWDASAGREGSWQLKKYLQ